MQVSLKSMKTPRSKRQDGSVKQARFLLGKLEGINQAIPAVVVLVSSVIFASGKLMLGFACLLLGLLSCLVLKIGCIGLRLLTEVYDMQKAGIYNQAVQGYRNAGGARVCSFRHSEIISENKIVLCDSSGEIIVEMIVCEGEWMSE